MSITTEQRLSSPDRTRKHCDRYSDANDDQHALTRRRWPVSRRRFRRRVAGRWPPQAPLELGQCKILIEVDGLSEGAYLGTSVEPAWYRPQVVVFERLEVAPRNLRLVRDLFERDTATFTSAAEELT